MGIDKSAHLGVQYIERKCTDKIVAAQGVVGVKEWDKFG